MMMMTTESKTTINNKKMYHRWSYKYEIKHTIMGTVNTLLQVSFKVYLQTFHYHGYKINKYSFGSRYHLLAANPMARRRQMTMTIQMMSTTQFKKGHPRWKKMKLNRNIMHSRIKKSACNYILQRKKIVKTFVWLILLCKCSLRFPTILAVKSLLHTWWLETFF